MSLDLFSGILPLLSAIISFVFAYFVFSRWRRRRRLYLLFWGIGLLLYGIGGAAEAYYGLFGWQPWVFRLWYLCGAILVAAWLGQGTVFLLMRKRVAWTLFALLLLGSIYAAYKVFTATLDPGLMLAGELRGHAITSSGVRMLTPFFNIYGTVMLVRGRRLFLLAVLAQASAAQPHHRQHLHRRGGAGAGVRRRVPARRHTHRPLPGRVAGRGADVHRLRLRHAQGG